MSGTLYVVGTPIGNLKDMTFRAVEILETVDVIAAEDTRNTSKLLNHFGIKTALLSYHEHNKMHRGEYILEKYLLQNRSVALVSDAGMPMISDPGLELISLCIQNNIAVTTIPGPTALVSAAILSNLVKGRFVFEGFLPDEKKKRLSKLKSMLQETGAVILYEAPHRLVKTLQSMEEILGGSKRIALCRELTKLHEEVLRFSLSESLSYFKQQNPRGEYVIVVEGADSKLLLEEDMEAFRSIPVQEHMQGYLDRGMEKKEAMKLVAKDRGVSKKEIYRLLLNESEENR